MPASLAINGYDWTTYANDVSVKPRDLKYNKGNVKGGVITPTPRTSVEGYTIQVSFPYLTSDKLAILEGLFAAQQPVTVTQTGFEFPSGSYMPVDLAKTRQKYLDSILYTVLFTLELDRAPLLPVPAPGSSLAAGGIGILLGL